ncbi:hypothetical protein B0H10DRAFT_2221634 [Mycena sp. CBHHK59/15]|nr:hypothetical protein B0H10DRAFT_2221634 [Mycena sp. CBHHK59/15]
MFGGARPSLWLLGTDATPTFLSPSLYPCLSRVLPRAVLWPTRVVSQPRKLSVSPEYRGSARVLTGGIPEFAESVASCTVRTAVATTTNIRLKIASNLHSPTSLPIERHKKTPPTVAPGPRLPTTHHANLTRRTPPAPSLPEFPLPPTPPRHHMPDDVFLASPRKAPAHRRSATSLRGASVLDDDAANGRFSLAHELAVALMPEPSAGSKLLAEEFGIEYDEGAEGIDEPGAGPQIVVQDGLSGDPSFADADPMLDSSFDDGPPEPPDFGGDPTTSHRRTTSSHTCGASTPTHLPAPLHPPPPPPRPAPAQPALERLAADVIRRLNETARDREGQVRELLGYEREFRRIAGEVGGQDVLGLLDALPVPEDDPADALASISEDVVSPSSPTRSRPHARGLSHSSEWETDPDVDRLGDADPAYGHEHDAEDDDAELASPTPLAQSISSASLRAAPGPASAVPQLADLRVLTTSLVASLTSVSESAQVNGAATADAGRKLRALRNRLGGWRAEWEGAERSRGASRGAGGAKRVDGRAVVQEHLHAFELALADAAVKTKAIMAA